jgi:hypothetical protein
MTMLVFAVLLVSILLLIGAVIKKDWLRIVLAIVLYSCVLLSVTAGMGGLRVYIERARAEGKSDDFIAGMVERSWQMRSARLEAAVYGFGLLLIGVAGWMRSPKTRDEQRGD